MVTPLQPTDVDAYPVLLDGAEVGVQRLYVLQWCCHGVAGVYNDVTLVSPWCFSVLTVVLPWCYRAVTVV